MRIIEYFKGNQVFIIFAMVLLLTACKKDSPEEVIDERNFKMGFTAWPYGPTVEAVNDTYDFIFANGDIYTEHVDDRIPWDELIAGTFLPEDFRANIEGKAARRPIDKDMLLSVSILNSTRDDIQVGMENESPTYAAMNDVHIEEAYMAYLIYLIDQFRPDYLVASIESNDLLLNSPDLWDDFRALMNNVRVRIKSLYPNIKIAESVTLHNWYESNLADHEGYITQVDALVAQMDFAAISFYPFFIGMSKQKDFQKAFDFLHKHTAKPIAFVETCHIANDLEVAALSLSIESDPEEQAAYLETLMVNANNYDYEFIIWWAHRDFDALWETFPDDIKDLGKIWRDTGLLNEDGVERPAKEVWSAIYGS